VRARSKPVHRTRRNPAHGLTTIGLTLGLTVLAGLGCNNRQSVIVPNRVLDRPTDVVLACVVRDSETGVLTPTSIEVCSDATCDDTRLVGFVANSERDNVALFSKCSNAVIDMDAASPGAQLIPAGKVPSSMTLTRGIPDACYAISANLGSCDLSLFDVTGLAAYAFDEIPVEDPSTLVNTITPTRGDGSPLGARPGQVLAVPAGLSNSIQFSDPVGGTGGVGDTGSDGTSGGGISSDTDAVATSSEEPGDAPVLRCDPDRPGSVYVTFPACQLIAEVDLRTSRILQSRQFVRDGLGNITVVDTGVDPSCPIDCPELFADDPAALANAPSGAVDGMYPTAMALVSPPDDPEDDTRFDDADRQVVDNSLYVGGLGADTLYELRFDGSRWTDDPLELELQDASGISVIRPTPAMLLPLDGSEPYHQFLYIVAGDGSTRVVRREFDLNRTELGRECDTQVDPTAVLDRVCHPAEFPGENPPDRRPFARGPGIRGPNGSIITDWTFQKSPVSAELQEDASATSAPFGKRGVTGVGTTSFGRLVFATFDQFYTDAKGVVSRTPTVSKIIDPLGVLDATIQPHMLWPQLDPTLTTVDPLALPRMADAEPARLLPGETEEADAVRVLAPSLRRIDLAYADYRPPCEPTADNSDDLQCQTLTKNKTAVCDSGDGLCRIGTNPLLSPHVDNADKLGSPDAGETGGTGLYKNEVVRAVVRDYVSWYAGDWALFWEGEIPDTSSRNGQLVCDKPGWEGGTCLSTEPGDTKIVDTNARFCDAGVLGGDKLLILGCSTDTDCGVGQYCLRDDRAAEKSTGICVSQSAYKQQDYLREVCTDLLYDPCAAPIPVREFLITRAFQSELWLQAMDKPLTSYLMYSDQTIGDGDMSVPVADLCSGKHIRDVVGAEAEDPTQNPYECEARLNCSEEQPETGCSSHRDCIVSAQSKPGLEEFPLCVNGLCRRICDPEKEDCVLRRLPGPTCMRELLPYVVQARNSFILRGPGAYDFLDQKVRTGPDGECYEDPEVSNLMTSRIRLGSDEADTRNNTAWPIPSCPPGTERPGPGTPNPCMIDVLRPAVLQEDAPDGLFHHFDYGKGNAIPALRFSNPMLSLVLDLTSVKDLLGTVPGTEQAWGTEFREFRRSRIPRNFRESFSTASGYVPFNVGVVNSSIALVGPTRIINAPETATVFIVDTSGGGGTSGVRGQVVRVNLAGGQVNPDVKFQVH
jgi:hypothetical protein